jgi:hypothetical protein
VPSPVVPVRGTLYDADVAGRLARPMYWQAEARVMRRGTWFRPSSGGKPLQESVAIEVENIHRAQPWRSAAAAAAAAASLLLSASASAAAPAPPAVVPALSSSGVLAEPATPSKVAAAAAGGKGPTLLYKAELPMDKIVTWYSDGKVYMYTRSMLGLLGSVAGKGEELVRGYGALRGGAQVDAGLAADRHCQCGAVNHLVLVRISWRWPVNLGEEKHHTHIFHTL